ncbi:C-type natriuretic peptide prohormone-like [Emydura macquarii macquarii]|uniref:C-type natriuretic peptide prohormone-like n=1 Tax=Emydura macquarii macquarii TaxID=1129001 RepID=UPI00352A5426
MGKGHETVLGLDEKRAPGATLADFMGDLLAAPLSADVPAPHNPPFALAGSRPPRDSPEPPSRDPTWARFFADFMSGQRKFRGRTKKAPMAQGCFGMKLDRIGALSGLGC